MTIRTLTLMSLLAISACQTQEPILEHQLTAGGCPPLGIARLLCEDPLPEVILEQNGRSTTPGVE